MDIALRYKLNFDVDRAPEAARIKELNAHINRLEDTAQKKNSSKAKKSSSKAPEQASKGKKIISVEEQTTRPLLHKRKRSNPVKKTLTSTTAGNERLMASKMMLPGSNRRIHSIHLAHQPSNTTRENPTGDFTPEVAVQSRLVPNSAPVNGPASSPDEDDHLTIKKLKTQHLQSSISRASIPSTPSPSQVQTTVSAPPTQTPTVVLEESDDEQGLQSDVLDLLVNSITNSEQPFSSTPIQEVTLVPLEIAEQPMNDTAEPPRAEQPITAEPITIESPREE